MPNDGNVGRSINPFGGSINPCRLLTECERDEIRMASIKRVRQQFREIAEEEERNRINSRFEILDL